MPGLDPDIVGLYNRIYVKKLNLWINVALGLILTLQKKSRQYASHVDIHLFRICQGATTETLSNIHCILFNDRLVFYHLRYSFLEFTV